MKFEVEGTAIVTVYAEVEAESLDEAKKLAEQLADNEFFFNGRHPEGMVAVDKVRLIG